MCHVGVLSSGPITSLFSHCVSNPIKGFPLSGFFFRWGIGGSAPLLCRLRSAQSLAGGEHEGEAAPKQFQVTEEAEAEGGQHGRDLQEPAGGKPPEEPGEGIRAQPLTETIHASAMGKKNEILRSSEAAVSFPNSYSCGEAKVGEAERGGERELEHHVVGTVGGAHERTKSESVETKMPRRRKRDRKITVCLLMNWSTYIHLEQDQKLLSLSLARERLRMKPY
ncbi:hypothetical protein BHE74_00022649 [Ensete ventricosum]|nr:hypothetical protein BHE74_00022649 [Ensete ventricosum]